MTIRAAIIGAGAIGDEHARCLRAAGDRVRLVAAADAAAERLEGFRARHEIPAFESGRMPPASAGDVRPTIEFISSLYKAAATGERVRRGSIRTGDFFYEHLAATLAPA